MLQGGSQSDNFAACWSWADLAQSAAISINLPELIQPAWLDWGWAWSTLRNQEVPLQMQRSSKHATPMAWPGSQSDVQTLVLGLWHVSVQSEWQWMFSMLVCKVFCRPGRQWLSPSWDYSTTEFGECRAKWTFIRVSALQGQKAWAAMNDQTTVCVYMFVLLMCKLWYLLYMKLYKISYECRKNFLFELHWLFDHLLCFILLGTRVNGGAVGLSPCSIKFWANSFDSYNRI